MKMTKAQQKRMVRDINSKVKKLYLAKPSIGMYVGSSGAIVSTQDMAAIEKLTSKWLKRIG
jgi:hypothetical protein